MKALKIPFEASKSPYDPNLVVKIKQGDEDIKAVRTKKISLDTYNKETEEAVVKIEKGNFVTHEEAIMEFRIH
ncbi:MAG TPA: hypothetical protein DCL77_12825 [Prolixibacteraceae bacterium]|jgi:hypothetical protein|nr:hypothetical protein [Prolixibacteraceae bacterium]